MTERHDHRAEPMAAQVNYVRIYTDADNVTRFEDLSYPLSPIDFAPPAPPVWVTAPMAASHVLIGRIPAGWEDLAHPSPARQLGLVLSGEGVYIAGDEERRLGAGDVLLMEDTEGPGHGLRAITDLAMAIVRL